ncbi:MAG TPA: PEP-CTERM sorting domain-containing protein [Lacipirellulaceae bacterium]|nr:PEP-CTERM sorting domain-containing protein [Lacipirellulaceae bacterium]
MKSIRAYLGVTIAVTLLSGWNAVGAPADFNFSISYSGSTITGRLIGLNLDANGNGTEVDPSSVELFRLPAIVGLPASDSEPYVFVPHTYERSTYFSGTFTSTAPDVYGFQISNYVLSPPSQNLLMSDSGGDVTLLFNFGAGLCGECGVATYGIQGEEDALWPAVNSFVSFSIVSAPGDFNHDGTVGAADYVAWRKTDGAQTGYDTWRAAFGTSAGSGSGSLAGATVPEPTIVSMLLLGAVVHIGRRSRRSLVSAER